MGLTHMAETTYTSPSGRQYTIRDLTEDDVDLMVDLFYHLSPETIYKRFHAPLENLPPGEVHKMANRLAHLDPSDQSALIALHEGEAIGIARFHRVAGTTDAESAIVIRDDHHREGLGTHLLVLLRDRALALGLTHLIAMVQAQNHPILKVVQRSGLNCRWRFEQGESYLVVDIGP